MSYKKKNGTSGIQTWNHKKGSGWRQISYTQYRPSSGGGYQTRRQSGGSGWSSWKTVVRPPMPSRAPVEYTRSPQEEALDSASWWDKRYRNGDAVGNTLNVLDDASMLLGIGGLILGFTICPVCGLAIGIGVSLYGIGAGLYKIFGRGDSMGWWDVAGSVIPFGAGKVGARLGRSAAGFLHSQRIASAPYGVPGMGQANRRIRQKSAALFGRQSESFSDATSQIADTGVGLVMTARGAVSTAFNPEGRPRGFLGF
ncbi:hypothetical protein ACFVWN_18755 [Nocardiopsis flavescens]|uniref:hypothetical protein n=1 Tax=Nocardiopsis flavescens TaxID=758803 RepID=UPI003658D6C3